MQVALEAPFSALSRPRKLRLVVEALMRLQHTYHLLHEIEVTLSSYEFSPSAVKALQRAEEAVLAAQVDIKTLVKP